MEEKSIKKPWKILAGLLFSGCTLFYPVGLVWFLSKILTPVPEFRFSDLLWILGITLLYSGLLFLACKKLRLPQGFTYLVQVVLWLLVFLLISLLQAFEVAYA